MEELASERVALLHPDWDVEFVARTDACADRLGAALGQKWTDPTTGKVGWRPSRFAPRALQVPESKWTTRLAPGRGLGF